MVRKYWIGVSEESDRRPENHDTFLVTSEEDLMDVQVKIAEWIAEDYMEALDASEN